MSTKYVQKWLATVVAGIYMAASGTTVADDTDVFFNTQQVVTTKPNILFVVDTSGSMAWQPNGNSTEPTTTTPSRMRIVKNSLIDLLDTVNNVNAGLARFTNPPGGPILMPVKDLDADSDDLPLVTSTIEASSDDASQNGTTVTLNGTTMTMSGSVKFGYRFTDIDIPRGATISKAIVSFSATNSDTGSISFRIQGQANGNAPTFTTGSNNISARTKTTAYRDWTPPSWTSNRRYSTADIANVIQEITDRSDWCGGNSIVILMERQGTGTGQRRLRSFDADSRSNNNDFERPTLNIQFQRTLPGTANGCHTARVISGVNATANDVVEATATPYPITTTQATFALGGDHKAVGLRFTGVRVPQGATIQEAKLSFYNNTAQAWSGDTTVTVQAVTVDNFTEFPLTDAALTGTTLAKTTAQTVTLPAWPQNALVGHSGDLKDHITAITGRTGWVSGNAIGLVLTYVSGNEKQASTFDGGYAPTLTIRYQAGASAWRFTARDAMKESVKQLIGWGNTPLADTLLESGLYFRGGPVEFGINRGPTTENASDRQYKRASSVQAVTGENHSYDSGCDPILDPFNFACADESLGTLGSVSYTSPISDSCQANHIVYLTDGEPTSHSARTNELFGSITQATTGTTQACPGNDVDEDGDDDGSGAGCLVGIAKFLYDEDQNSVRPNKQNISTHFIGFNIDIPLLNVAARAGGTSTSKLATDAVSLAAVFSQIINSIEKRSGTFVSAGVTINQTNRLTNLDQLYFAMFEPSLSPRWVGNLKRYKLGDGGDLLDADDLPAVESDSDQFFDTARSFWSTTDDGNSPRLGGAASKLTNNRTLYTNLSGTTNVDLAADGNEVHESNDDLTAAILSVTATERTRVVQWARGVDVLDEAGGTDENDDGIPDGDGSTTDANKVFGDPLHSRPSLINYKVSGDADGKLRVFVGTNRGELHSIDTETGEEEWAFVPKDLLPKYRLLMNNEDAVTKPYGLDGSIVPYLKDTNRDGMIDKAATGTAAEKAMLYVGMRRGGSNYYALDVTDPDAPKLKFVIQGGAGDYAKLSQTWSRPVITKAKLLISGVLTEKTVMIFGGGYSTAQDTATTPVNDSVGNIVYIADAETGGLLWSSDQLTGLGMNKSVPADIAAIDLDGNGFVDHIYAADMGANVWRFDVLNDGTITAGATPRALASFQDAVTEASNRRFYGGVDVGLIQRDDGSNYVVVAVGSGFREKPLDTEINDHFYVFRDEGVFDNTIASTLTLSNLVDITETFGDEATEATEEDGKFGWYYRFATDGEKSLTAPIIFNNTVMFTTYVPPGDEVINCAGGAGTGRFYMMSILNGSPVNDADGTPLNSERYQQLDNCPTCGMVPPQVIFGDDGQPVVLIGNKGVDIEPPRDTIKRVKWRHNRQ